MGDLRPGDMIKVPGVSGRVVLIIGLKDGASKSRLYRHSLIVRYISFSDKHGDYEGSFHRDPTSRISGCWPGVTIIRDGKIIFGNKRQ